ncbi:MAG: DUF1559 domain-containing protein, partial [Thermoguttaceae bacterium]|nr:DUF1559 domain-containing protein [Thermoguttaceae bacterium]
TDKGYKGAFAANTSGAAADFVNLCLARFNPTTKELTGDTTGGRGAVVFDGRVTMGGFTTVFPPNSHSCARNGWLTNGGVFSVTSNHSGGVNGVMFDGSVRFISETIDAGSTTVTSPWPKSGKSDYGVWGAMGSVNGGETIAM